MRNAGGSRNQAEGQSATLALLLALVAMSVTAWANVQEIRPRPNNNWGRDDGRGEMNIRLQVDEDVEVAVRGNRIFIRTLSGSWAQERGSDYSAPLPLKSVPVQFSKRSGRGRAWLVDQPSRSNGFTARIRIRDPQRGEGRYHIRLRYATESWGWENRTANHSRDEDLDGLAANPVAVVRAFRGRSPSNRGRLDSWNRLPGHALDSRRRERVRDIHGRYGGRFEFRGRVDDEVLFFIRGTRVTAQTQFGRRLEVERWSLDEPVPVGRPLQIRVSKRDGRGHVEILQEPHPRNNYTTVMRVSDGRGGRDRYHFRMDWHR